MADTDLRTPWVIPQDYGAHGDGATNDLTAFQQADATGKAILVPPAVYLIHGELVLHAPIRFEPGALLRPVLGGKITLNGPIDAGPYSIFDVSQVGTVVLGGDSHIEAYPEWWGAPHDRVHSDSDALDAAIAALPEGGTLKFPANRTYLLSRTIYGRAGLRWVFNSTTFKADPAGQYDHILDNKGKNTGYDVFFATDHSRDSTHVGRLTLIGSGIDKLCGISGHKGSAGGGQHWEWVNLHYFDRGIYALVQDGNTIVAHSFGFVYADSNVYDVYCVDNGSDDAVFGVMRSMGSKFERYSQGAGVYLEATRGLVFHSLYVNAHQPTRKGLVLAEQAAVVCNHVYVEGHSMIPISIEGRLTTLTIHDLKLAHGLYSANGEVIHITAAASSCVLDIIVNARALESSATHLCRIDTHSTMPSGRTIILKMAFGTGVITPVVFTGDAPSVGDKVIVYADDGLYRYFYRNGQTVPHHEPFVCSDFQSATALGTLKGKVEVFNAHGQSLGFIPVYDS